MTDQENYLFLWNECDRQIETMEKTYGILERAGHPINKYAKRRLAEWKEVKQWLEEKFPELEAMPTRLG